MLSGYVADLSHCPPYAWDMIVSAWVHPDCITGRFFSSQAIQTAPTQTVGKVRQWTPYPHSCKSPIQAVMNDQAGYQGRFLVNFLVKQGGISLLPIWLDTPGYPTAPQHGRDDILRSQPERLPVMVPCHLSRSGISWAWEKTATRGTRLPVCFLEEKRVHSKVSFTRSYRAPTTEPAKPISEDGAVHLILPIPCIHIGQQVFLSILGLSWRRQQNIRGTPFMPGMLSNLHDKSIGC